jgi:hypothetical protein
MSKSLSLNPVVEKNIRRLREMGLKVYVESEEPDSVTLVIDAESAIHTISRIIKRRLTWEKNYIVYDKERGAIIAIFWKGAMPNWINRYVRRVLERGGKAW